MIYIFIFFIFQPLIAQSQQTNTSDSITDVSFFSSLSSSSLTGATPSINGTSGRNQVQTQGCFSYLSDSRQPFAHFCFFLILCRKTVLFAKICKKCLTQCSGGELVSVREVCGVCHLAGGDLTHCLQCLGRFHAHCHFSRWDIQPSLLLLHTHNDNNMYSFR